MLSLNWKWSRINDKGPFYLINKVVIMNKSINHQWYKSQLYIQNAITFFHAQKLHFFILRFPIYKVFFSLFWMHFDQDFCLFSYFSVGISFSWFTFPISQLYESHWKYALILMHKTWSNLGFSLVAHFTLNLCVQETEIMF